MIIREFHEEFSYILMSLRKKLNESSSCISLFNITALKANYKWNFRIQLFRPRLSHKSVKAYATMPIGITGSKSLVLFVKFKVIQLQGRKKYE